MFATVLNAHPETRPAVTAGRRDHGHVALTDGTVVRYRPIRPSDESALQRFHDRLSAESVRLRFMGVLPHLSARQADHFARVDGRDRFALVALDPARPTELIAVVRFDRDPGTARAEYAAVVADGWQGRGLGLGLTHRLIAAARARGVRSLYALVLPENGRMLNLLRDVGLLERLTHDDDVERIEIELAPLRAPV